MSENLENEQPQKIEIIDDSLLSIEQEIPLNLRFTSLDRLVLPSFLELINTKDIELDFGDENFEKNQIGVSYTKKGLKWIKDVKKKDKHWDEEDFIGKIIHYTARAAENLEDDLEDMKILDAKIVEEDKIEIQDAYQPDKKSD
jgi:hypothetical protein